MEKRPVLAAFASQEEQTQPQRSNLITVIGNRIRGEKAYRQAKQEFKSAQNEVVSATYESTHDEEGYWLPVVPYTAGLHLKSPLTEAEHPQFLQEYHQNVQKAFPEGEITAQSVLGLNVKWPGCLYENVYCEQIESVPDIQYNQTFMSEKQIADLEHRRRLLYHYGSTWMAVELHAVGEHRSVSFHNTPIELRMDKEPTHELVIQTRDYYGFKRQEEVARQILDCITQTSIMRDKLPPVDMPPQLPTGE